MGELITISWPSHHQKLSEGLWRLLEEKFSTDFEFVVDDDDDTSQHQQIFIRTHYLLLSIFCPAIKSGNERRYSFNNELEMEEEDVKCLVEFIYRGKVEVEEERVNNLRCAAERLGFKTLVELIDKCSKGLRKCSGKIKDNKTSKRKRKKPIKIPQLEQNSTGRQSNKRKISRDKKYFESSEGEEEEESEITDEDFSPENFSNPSKSNETISSQDSEKRRGRKRTSNSEIENVNEDPLPPPFNPEQLLCTVCDKKFKTRQTFRQHMRRHTYPDVVQQCPHCPFKAYNFKSKLFYHLASKHQMDLQGNILQKTFKCPDCEYSCVAEFQLKSHKIYKHGAKIHKCDVCSYASNSRADLRKHQDGVHGNKRPFMCETCGFAAKSSSNLHLHLSTHKEKVVCEICGVTVKCRGLTLHMQTVHGENRKPFHCHLCSLATRCKFNLKVHLTRVHKLPPDEVKHMLSKKSTPYNMQQHVESVLGSDQPVMTLEQTIDPNLSIPFLNFGNDTQM